MTITNISTDRSRRSRTNVLRLALTGALFAFASAAPAQSTTKPAAAHAHAEHAATAPAVDVPAAAQAAVANVDAFGKALAAGDFAQVERLLDPAVVILESGGAERSRAEYLGHHARSDAQFLAKAHVSLQRRIARVDGNTAWVASESEVHASKDGKALTLLNTETMVLGKTADGWRIVHVHWSSRPKKAG